MGQSPSKELSLEEHMVAAVRSTFQRYSQKSDSMNKECFKAVSSHFLDPKLQEIIFESLKVGKNDNEVITEEGFIRIAEVGLGGYELQAEGIYMCGKSLQEIVESVVATFFNSEECETSASVRGLLVTHILVNAPHKKSSVENISHWLASVNTFPTILRRITRKLCLGYYNKILPSLETSTILTPAAVAVITLHLPYEHRYDWALLYASNQHGISFSQLMQRVDDAGPCLIVVESESGRVFGGFASEGFRRGQRYKGDHGCFLFEDRTILNIYHATCFDTRFAYLNNSKTDLSGIGMGGGMQNWSFFINADLESGTSTSNISTFEKCWLAGEDIFTLKDVEVWRIGPPRNRKRFDSDGSEIIWDNKSVLDRDPGAIAIVQLSGKELVGEAARDLQMKSNNM